MVVLEFSVVGMLIFREVWVWMRENDFVFATWSFEPHASTGPRAKLPLAAVLVEFVTWWRKSPRFQAVWKLAGLSINSGCDVDEENRLQEELCRLIHTKCSELKESMTLIPLQHMQLHGSNGSFCYCSTSPSLDSDVLDPRLQLRKSCRGN